MPVIQRVAHHLHPWLRELRAGEIDRATFWSRVEAAGTPLIEADPSSPRHRLVTHLWRAREEDRWVVLSLVAGSPAAHLLERATGTDVCHATYRYRDDVRMAYAFAPNAPLTDYDSADTVELAELMAHAEAGPPLPDPLHRHNERFKSEAGRPDTELSIVAMPNAADESLIHKREGIARGRIDRHEFTSARLGNTRRVWVYTPPVPPESIGADGLPMLLAFDGGMYISQMPAHRVLDNLLADGRITPTIGVFVDNATAKSRNVDLPCSEDFAHCIEHELLPWLAERYPITRDPARSFVTGMSYGGLASLWMGYRLPHVFGNVIAQAPSLWWGQGHVIEVPRNGGTYRGEWLVDAFERSPRLPLRIWLEIGLMEHPLLMLASVRRMRAVLEAKGYDVTYREPPGGHESATWRGTLAQALAHMLAIR